MLLPRVLLGNSGKGCVRLIMAIRESEGESHLHTSLMLMEAFSESAFSRKQVELHSWDGYNQDIAMWHFALLPFQVCHLKSRTT